MGFVGSMQGKHEGACEEGVNESRGAVAEGEWWGNLGSERAVAENWRENAERQ